jgi:acetylornithine deacetylase/succinyl-diaminopimelate desuccinylase-like protein
VRAEDEVVELCSDLIRFDSSNPTSHERAIAEHVATLLSEVGLQPEIYESEPCRSSVVARWEGENPGRDALLIHGHLDVVPADASEWRVHPFSGEVSDGYVHGRGAVDMKDMDAMTLAVVRDWIRQGRRPPRDIVLAFVADEEAGGGKGAHWLVDNHPELFEGCSEAISEVGGFSVTLPNDQRMYLVETAQKGIGWMRLTAQGTAGHGSMTPQDNAVARLAEAIARIGTHHWPVTPTPTVRRLLREVADAYEVTGPDDRTLDTDALLDVAAGEGAPARAAEDELNLLVARLGSVGRIVGPTLRHTANPTVLDAGSKVNVIPSHATAHVDGRFLPGHESAFEQGLDELLGDRIAKEWIWHDVALETGFDGALVDTMVSSLLAEDPGARVAPYMLSGGTDAKSFSQLGIRCFGFSPLQLPPELDFAAMFHGVDERIAEDSLRFGVRVLDRFLRAC